MSAGAVTTDDALTLDGLIDSLIEQGFVDPHEVADKAETLLSDEQRAEAIRIGLRTQARHRIKKGRRPRSHREGKSGASRDSGSNESDKWRDVSEATQDPMEWRVNVTGREDGWRLLMDCTGEDVARIADMYRTRARQNMAYAQRYQALAEEMRKHGAETVGDLPRDVFERVMEVPT